MSGQNPSAMAALTSDLPLSTCMGGMISQVERRHPAAEGDMKEKKTLTSVFVSALVNAIMTILCRGPKVILCPKMEFGDFCCRWPVYNVVTILKSDDFSGG